MKPFFDRLNAILERLHGDGTLKRLSMRYFGTTTPPGRRASTRNDRADGAMNLRPERIRPQRSGARHRSLMARLVLTFLALSLLMVGIVGTVSYLRARDSLETSVFERSARPSS